MLKDRIFSIPNLAISSLVVCLMYITISEADTMKNTTIELFWLRLPRKAYHFKQKRACQYDIKVQLSEKRGLMSL